MFRSTARLLSRRRISVLAAAMALGTSGAMLGAVPASAAANGPAQNNPGLLNLFGQTTTVNVPAITPPTSSHMPGVSTSVNLAPGEPAVITATGTAACHVGSASCTLSAKGDGSAAGASPAFLDPNAPAYSLVGEVGSAPLISIGTGPTTVRGPGELRLGYNDQFGYYSDNGGGYTVTIQTCSVYGVPVLGPLLCSLLGPSAG